MILLEKSFKNQELLVIYLSDPDITSHIINMKIQKTIVDKLDIFGRLQNKIKKNKKIIINEDNIQDKIEEKKDETHEKEAKEDIFDGKTLKSTNPTSSSLTLSAKESSAVNSSIKVLNVAR
jgi:hypothetical protein